MTINHFMATRQEEAGFVALCRQVQSHTGRGTGASWFLTMDETVIAHTALPGKGAWPKARDKPVAILSPRTR